jgi:hypothetical protein
MTFGINIKVRAVFKKLSYYRKLIVFETTGGYTFLLRHSYVANTPTRRFYADADLAYVFETTFANAAADSVLEMMA